jgi:hypothetical protein
MAKIKNPVRFSEQFNVDPQILSKAGILDPFLNADTNLFIDPMLLEKCGHKTFREHALSLYNRHFTDIIKLLRASKVKDDVAWKGAVRLIKFPEVKGICLGYSAGSVDGSAFGPGLSARVLHTAHEIVQLGVDDPTLFSLMALLEEDVGPDRISDMTATIILPALLDLNDEALKNIPVKREKHILSAAGGKTIEVMLPTNPFGGTPIILVPSDILRDLPLAADWDGVVDAAQHNQSLRDELNTYIADIWAKKSAEQKDNIRAWAVNKKENFETLIALIQGATPSAYDLASDPQGLLSWAKYMKSAAKDWPIDLKDVDTKTVEGVNTIVQRLIAQFKFLIEDRRLYEELYNEGKPRMEKSAQKLFYAVAHSYCEAYGLDLIPEAETGYGPVDFKISNGSPSKVIVEIKLSTNKQVIHGYETQLERYKKSEKVELSHFVVLDVGEMGEKAERLIKAKNEMAEKGLKPAEIHLIDGIKKPAASKLPKQ